MKSFIETQISFCFVWLNIYINDKKEKSEIIKSLKPKI